MRHVRRRAVEVTVRALGLAGLVGFWAWALSDPGADVQFRNGVLAAATIGMAAAQQPWLTWLRTVGLSVVLWPACMLVTGALAASLGIEFAPGPVSGPGLKAAILVFLVITLGEAVLVAAWFLPLVWRRWLEAPSGKESRAEVQRMVKL